MLTAKKSVTTHASRRGAPARSTGSSGTIAVTIATKAAKTNQGRRTRLNDSAPTGAEAAKRITALLLANPPRATWTSGGSVRNIASCERRNHRSSLVALRWINPRIVATTYAVGTAAAPGTPIAQ